MSQQKGKTDDENQTLFQPLCVCVCLWTFLRVHEHLHVYMICFQEHLVRGFEMQVSTRRKVCLYDHRRMFSPMLPGTLNDFFFSLSGRSWEELNSFSHINLKAKIRQDVTSSWTLAIQYFTLSVSLLLPLSFGKKKRSLPLANQLLQSLWIPHNCNQSW